MKPPAFTYHRPATVPEAVEMLAAHASEAKVLAGGQSLVPLLNMRLAAPGHLIDINGLSELGYLRCEPGVVRVGALARHARTERDPAAFAALPLLGQATHLVAHATIRNRGTTVGSLVHADPAAELPAVLLVSDGEVDVVSASGSRTVGARDFFLGPLESAVRPGELAIEARFPALGPRTGTSFVEISRRAGDYALCGVAMMVTVDSDDRVSGARACYISVGPTPVLVDLTGVIGAARFDSVDWAAAGRYAASQVQAEDDIHATAAYREHLVGVLTGRAGQAATTLARRRADVAEEL